MSQTQNGAKHGAPPSTPRWVLVFGIVVFILAVLFILMHLTGLAPMGGHG